MIAWPDQSSPLIYRDEPVAKNLNQPVQPGFQVVRLMQIFSANTDNPPMYLANC